MIECKGTDMVDGGGLGGYPNPGLGYKHGALQIKGVGH